MMIHPYINEARPIKKFISQKFIGYKGSPDQRLHGIIESNVLFSSGEEGVIWTINGSRFVYAECPNIDIPARSNPE